MQYEWILFDADETLFSFDAFTGLKQVFAELGVEFTKADHLEYELINQPLWSAYQNGEIDVTHLQEARFAKWGERVGVAPLELNRRFSMTMAKVCQPFAGMEQTIKALASKAKLGIITNGFEDMQQIRLDNTGLSEYFQFVVVSETVGVAKPDVGIFQHAFSLMGQVDKSHILMVGDNPESDIKGGNNAGIDTCWLQLGRKHKETSVIPTFTASDWYELADKLLGKHVIVPETTSFQALP